jgi:enoyl-CoA hydratase/carnithine racemase
MGDSQLSEVVCDIQDGVALVTLSRPGQYNAWTPTMEVEYFDLLTDLDRDGDVRVIVLRGAGDKSFCPGADMRIMNSSSSFAAVLNPLRTRPMTYARSIRKPMIAAVNGMCAGIGLVQILCCDIRFAIEGVTMTTSFVRRGLPAEFGVAWLLVRAIGSTHAADLLLSGRRFTSDEAAAMGLINKTLSRDEFMPFVMAYARDIAANCSPQAMATMKEQMRRDWERSLVAATGEALLLGRDPARRDEFREGVRSFVEKRPPDFAPLPPPLADF